VISCGYNIDCFILSNSDVCLAQACYPAALRLAARTSRTTTRVFASLQVGYFFKNMMQLQHQQHAYALVRF
jgi:hypothetical protein